MPSISGWGLRRAAFQAWFLANFRFYALDIGLGFATRVAQLAQGPVRFYALDIGLGFATAHTAVPRTSGVAVSMPSISGWDLRRTTT